MIDWEDYWIGGLRMLEGVPLWGQVSLFGLSLGLNITFIILLARGILATRPQIEQVQKIADTFQRAWEVSENRGDKMVETTGKLLSLSETILAVLEARDPIMHPPTVIRHTGGNDDVG